MVSSLYNLDCCAGDGASDVHGYFADGIFEGSIKYKGIVYGIEVSTSLFSIPSSSPQQ